MVQLKNIAMTETLDIFADVCDLLQVLVLTIAKDRVVHKDAIYTTIFVCCQNIGFKLFPINFSKFKFEATESSLSELFLATKKNQPNI